MSEDRIVYKGEWQYSISKKFVCNTSLSRDSRFLFIVLKSFTNDTKKEAFPSRELLCKIMQCSENSLTKYLKELKGKGFLHITRERKENGLFLHNVYEIIETDSNSPNSNFANGEKENLTNASITDMVNEETNNYPYINIYTFWNEHEIKVHRKLTDQMRKKITTTLKTYTEEEIKQSISNYSLIVNDKSQEYWFDYRWTLKDFLSRGIEKFLGDVEMIKINYRYKRKQNVVSQTEKVLELS